jgi:hypothetical protein
MQIKVIAGVVSICVVVAGVLLFYRPVQVLSQGTATQLSPNEAQIHIKVQNALGEPVAVPNLYMFQCLEGVHDCNAINFCSRKVPVQYNTSEEWFTVSLEGNECRIGAGAVLDTSSVFFTGVSVSPVADIIQDQWIPPNQEQVLVEHNFAWGSPTAGQTYDVTLTVDSTVSTKCLTQKKSGDYDCSGTVTMTDFIKWIEDFQSGTTTLAFLGYWQRAVGNKVIVQ